MYNPRKDFEKNVNKILGNFLKKNGFKRFKTRNYVRITSSYILQIINFQKSAGFAYYVNMSSIPLANMQKSFFAEGGLRIQNLNPNFFHHDLAGRFEFGTEYIMIKNLEEVLDFLQSKAIYWFDLLGNIDTFLEYENSIDKPEFLRSLLKNSIRQELNFAFLQLQCQKYNETQKYLDMLNEQIANNNEQFYLNRVKKEISLLLNLIDNSDFNSINNLIQENIKGSIENLSLNKFKIYNASKISLKDYLSIKYDKEYNIRIPGSRGVEHYFHILNGDIDTFENLKIRLIEDFEILEISKFRFAVSYHETAAFHFVLNTFESVEKDTSEICEVYKRKGIEFRELENQKTRIEFWCDFTTKINTFPLRDKLTRIIYHEISKLIFIPGQYKFIEKQKLPTT